MRTLRGALVGYGFIAERGHAPAYLSPDADATDHGARFEITAVADPVPARRALAQRQIPGVRVYEDHRAMLDAEAGALDFVDVATPPS